MNRLSRESINKIVKLRKQGKTYLEITRILKLKNSKSTLSYYCKGLDLSTSKKERIRLIVLKNLVKARNKAAVVNSRRRLDFQMQLKKNNSLKAELIMNKNISKIALSMLCLGEASKYGRSAFALGNSNPQIIVTFLQLLKRQDGFDRSKLRCTVQCRADQDVNSLETYWSEITSIPKSSFYKAQVDPRTIGRPTKNKLYKGVLRINYSDAKLQQDLESLALLIYNQLSLLGPVV